MTRRVPQNKEMTTIYSAKLRDNLCETPRAKHLQRTFKDQFYTVSIIMERKLDTTQKLVSFEDYW
jgi:predicted esterase